MDNTNVERTDDSRERECEQPTPNAVETEPVVVYTCTACGEQCCDDHEAEFHYNAECIGGTSRFQDENGGPV